MENLKPLTSQIDLTGEAMRERMLRTAQTLPSGVSHKQDTRKAVPEVEVEKPGVKLFDTLTRIGGNDSFTQMRGRYSKYFLDNGAGQTGFYYLNANRHNLQSVARNGALILTMKSAFAVTLIPSSDPLVFTGTCLSKGFESNLRFEFKNHGNDLEIHIV